MSKYETPQHRLLTEVEARPGIDEAIIVATDAAGMSEAIPLWLQLPVDQRDSYINGELAPIKFVLIPEDRDQKEQFYKDVGKRLVSEWKQDIGKVKLRNKVRNFLEYSSHELFFPEINNHELSSFGYAVDTDGLVQGIDESYAQTVINYAEAQGKDIDYLNMLGDKMGGFTKDFLRNAKNQLSLSREERDFINNFIVFERGTDRARAHHLRTLQLTERSRRYYLEAGIELEDFMVLWGINKDFQTTKSIAYNEADTGKHAQELLDAAMTFTTDQAIPESEVQYQRGVQIGLPPAATSWEDILERNQGLVNEAEQTMRYRKITGREPQASALHFTGLPGQRTRGNNITYTNKHGENVNIQIMGAYSPISKIGPTLGHEFTHELHSNLIQRYAGGISVWNDVDSNVKEQFAKLVDRSLESIFEQKAIEAGKKPDNYMPALERWYQFLYGYSQLRFLEEVAKYKQPMTEQQLLSVDKKINKEIKKLNKIELQGKILDLTKVRVAPYDMLHPNDGLNYVGKNINAMDAPVQAAKQTETKPDDKKKTARELMEDRWGKNWIQDDAAYRVFVVAMLESARFQKTTKRDKNGKDVTVEPTQLVVDYIKSLIDAGPGAVETILELYGVQL